MVKKQNIFMASDDRRHNPYLSNLNSLSKNHRSRSSTLTFLEAHRITSAKVVEHEHEHEHEHAASQSSGSTTQRKNPFEVGPYPSSGRRNAGGDEILRFYPFVEEPVRFNFDDDYGRPLFLDPQREISCDRHNYGRARLGLVEVKRAESSSHDVYALSSEADMVSSFLRDGLF